MTLEEYYEKYGSQITQASEKLFVEEFLYPLVSSKIGEIEPQFPFIDRTGRKRRIDFVYHGAKAKIALEVNGETYHAEGIIPNEMFDDNLFRQNEILRRGYLLERYSYNQLQSPFWRTVIKDSLLELFRNHAPELLTEYEIKPTALQEEVLHALDFYRNKEGWKKGVAVMPTGTGKTILSALDAMRFGGRVLFLVHLLDIIEQSVSAYKFVWNDIKIGKLTGIEKENIFDCDVLFASKDTLRQPSVLGQFSRDWFDFIVIDEVHHGQSPTYQEIIKYFTPKFMLGMTATPDRTDRKDIFELFDYNKVYEISLVEVIERGFLVPYTYHGLTDNIDYSKIRYENNRYRVDDLERFLIIPERNEAILKEYLEKGEGAKAIGFCVSIKHAERMAEFFCSKGIEARPIHSKSPTRDQDLADFRENKIQIAFTVDLFNEGVDFPNVRVLLFLRPTESKTVFIQQLGRGLRLCSGKERAIVLDFIGNYKRANQIRTYLAKSKQVTELEENGRRKRKIEYLYANGCEVAFDDAVEEILNQQDKEELGVSEIELKDAYFALAEILGRKPSRKDLDEQGEYKSNIYARVFGSWLKFLREIGEYTEASYHYPQGTHLGHILSILKVFGSGKRKGTHFDDEFIRLRGGLGEGRLGIYQRQVKYKLQAAMELGILPDDRSYSQNETYPIELTPLGKELYSVLEGTLNGLDLDFPRGADGIPSTNTRDNEAIYNEAIRNLVINNSEARNVIFRVFLNMHAVKQMLAYLYHIARKNEIERGQIYEQFFQAPFVKQFCDQEGIEEATLEASRRRCPFLLNILDACDIIKAERQSITVKKLALMPFLVKPDKKEEEEKSLLRINEVKNAFPDSAEKMQAEDLSIMRELFGAKFLTADYHLKEIIFIED